MESLVEVGGPLLKQRYICVFYLFLKNPEGSPQKNGWYAGTWNHLESLRDLGVSPWTPLLRIKEQPWLLGEMLFS